MAEVEHGPRTVVSAMFNQLAPLAAEENEPSPASSGGPLGSPTVGGGKRAIELGASAAEEETSVVGVPQGERQKRALDGGGTGDVNTSRPEGKDDALPAVAEGETVAGSTVLATNLSNLPNEVGTVETEESAESPEGKQGGKCSAEAESIVKETVGTGGSGSSVPPPLLPPDGEQESATPTVSSSSSVPSGSRMICLRGLRPGGEGAGKAQAAATAAVEAAAVAAAAAKETTVGAGKPSTGALVGAVVSNKVVDLREVKKVRPVVLTPTAAATEANVASSSDDEAGGGGLVKVDLSAGKRMIEFQLKVNAAEEKREAARLKSERERAEAAIAEASQNALALVNARIEAQRRGRGGSSGGGNGARALAEAQIRVLAERHGIRVHILDEEQSSRVEQIRALAREHGLQVQTVGEGEGKGEGGDDGQSDDGEPQEAAEAGAGAESGVEAAEGKPEDGGTSTPPPVLSSVRPRPKARTTSPSSAPRVLSKAPAKENAGGVFTGPARMMRMALSASSICKAGDKEISTAAHQETDAGSREKESRRASTGGLTAKRLRPAWATSDGDAKMTAPTAKKTAPTIKPASDNQASATSKPSAVTSDSSRTNDSNGSESEGSASADGNSDSGKQADGKTAAGATRKSGDRVVVQDSEKSSGKNSTGSGSGGVKRPASVVRRVGAEAGTGAVESSSSPAVRSRVGDATSATKANAERSKSLPLVGDTTRKKTRGVVSPNGSPAVRTRAGEAASATKANAERSDSLPTVRDANRKRTRGVVSPSGGVSRSDTSSSVSKVSAKKMRLMDPKGGASEPNTPTASAARPARRGAGNGGAGWQAGNNNLFKGAMAGILARGKRPDP